jgi:hypothetical protein
VSLTDVALAAKLRPDDAARLRVGLERDIELLLGDNAIVVFAS